MAPELEGGTKLAVCLATTHRARDTLTLQSFLSFTGRKTHRSVAQTCAFCMTESGLFCAIQEERLARRTSTGWCTLINSAWSLRGSSSITATSP